MYIQVSYIILILYIFCHRNVSVLFVIKLLLNLTHVFDEYRFCIFVYLYTHTLHTLTTELSTNIYIYIKLCNKLRDRWYEALRSDTALKARYETAT